MLQVHVKNLWKKRDDPTRCDNRPIAAPVTTVPVVDVDAPAPTPRLQRSEPGLSSLARRQELNLETRRFLRASYTITQQDANSISAERCRNMASVQDAWKQYKASVRDLCCSKFWDFFLPLHTFSGVAISTALSSAKKVFVDPGSSTAKNFPVSRRTLMAKIASVPSFWDHVMHTTTIDLSEFRLASGTKKMSFTFIDPIWGWLVAAERQHALDLHWKPVEPAGNPVYGGGVQYGECFRECCRSIPKGSYPMCVSLHWDGTSEHRGLASTPICVGVTNTNNSDVSTQYCLAYIPKVPDDSPEFRKGPQATQIKFSIRQQCIAAIMRVLDDSAEHGVICTLPNQDGIGVARVLVPRLCAMNLDQPEAQLFFGMLNRTSCSKCKWRRGYSAFRTCSKQSGLAVKRLYRMAKPGGAFCDVATQKLKRWGFNAKRKCCLLEGGLQHLLVNLPGADEVFPCVDYRDRMHGLTMFLHRVVTQTIAGLSKKILSGPSRLLLDQRLRFVCQRRSFREHGTRRSYRVQKTIFSDVGMTAVDKVCLIFLLPHVLGPDADMFPRAVRQPLLTAVAYAQLLLIVVRGRRNYTVPELRRIFDDGFKLLFGALQSLLFIDYNERATLHQRHPTKHKAPTTLSLKERIWEGHDNTATEDTSDDSTLCGLPKFSHGSCGLTHQHWVDQLISGGAFGVHCTQAAEAIHKTCMKLPAQRVRHLHANQTQAHMQSYLKSSYLFEEMLRDTPTPVATRRPPATGISGLIATHMPSGDELLEPAEQRRFIHPEIRLACYEFLDLLCDQFLLRPSRESYSKLLDLEFHFGQKLIQTGGKIYWATDSRYNHIVNASGECRRRDALRLQGVESTPTHTNALCCEAVAFVAVENISRLTLPDHLLEQVTHDSLTFVIGRWFEPHKDAVTRDSESRPICPGPLFINHCLWKYAVAERDRRAIVTRTGARTAAVQSQLRAFGPTTKSQNACLESERRAYYGLVLPANIVSTCNMCPVFVPGTSEPDNTTWLESVTLI